MKTLRTLSSIAFAATMVAFVTSAAVQQPAETAGDSEVAHTLLTATELAIEHANLALETTENERVLEYAETLLANNKTVNENLGTFIEGTETAPAPNKWSEKLMASTAEAEAELVELEGTAFDARFAETQAEFQQTLIDLLSESVIPDAETDELKTIATSLHSHAMELLRISKDLVAPIEG